MSIHIPLSFVVLALATLTLAQSGASTALEPLASKHFTWPDIPFQVTGNQGGVRGPQSGFNLCNSTTENQQSLCQVSSDGILRFQLFFSEARQNRRFSLITSATFACGAQTGLMTPLVKAKLVKLPGVQPLVTEHG